MSGTTNERIPFIFSAETCEWDEKLNEGVKDWTDKLGERHKKHPEGDILTVEEFYQGLRDSVVTSLKKCDEKILASWKQIYKHSYDIKNNREKVIARDATINQQTAALAGGIPAAGALGVGVIPFCKFCLKFFSK